MANKGLVRDSLLKMVHILGDHWNPGKGPYLQHPFAPGIPRSRHKRRRHWSRGRNVTKQQQIGERGGYGKE